MSKLLNTINLGKRTILFFLSLVLSFLPVMAEKKSGDNDAEKQMRKMLGDKFGEVEFDENDQSFNFRYKDTLYWITIEESQTKNKSFHKFTIHQNPFIITSRETGESSREIVTSEQAAIEATNWLSSQSFYQAFVNNGKIYVQYVWFFPHNRTGFKDFLENILEEMHKSEKMLRGKLRNLQSYNMETNPTNRQFTTKKEVAQDKKIRVFINY